MELLRTGLKSVLGAPQPGHQSTGAETIERLIDRAQSSTLLEDRRDACRALKALSRKYRVEVGAQGMDTLRQILEADRNNGEIVGYALDTLCNIMAPEIFEEEECPEVSRDALGAVGEQFTEIFIKHPDNVVLVLGFLEEYDFHVRWPAVKLLTALLANKLKDIQEIILVSPMGVSKLMDLLSDSREVIRNDALLLLVQLTKGNANIQKIVAFENAFDRLFDVINEEGYADGGIVVEDCLLLMLNLLRNNTSNQNFFKEGSYIQRLAPMFHLPPEGNEGGWSAQKVSNIHCMLQVVRTLVSPSNPAQVTSSCQKIMKACGLLEKLCDILMASGVPADILTETINAVAEVIRGNQGNQEYFANVMAPSNPPRPAVVVLLMSMVNEKQPFALRCAVLYCFQCYLYKNELCQSQIVQTLLPSGTEVNTLTVGQLLCGGLFSPDALSNWFSSVALSHSLVENPAQKEQLLRVLLATSIGNPPVSLLHQCTALLQQGNKVQTKLGILMMLCTWLSHCPTAVSQFLNIPSSIPYLTSQIAATGGTGLCTLAGSNEHDDNEELVQAMCAFLLGICVHFNDNSVPAFSKENLRQLIAKRIGLETFLDKLGEVSKHELYSRAAKHPQLRPRQPSELLYDHEFCRLFKALEGVVTKAVTPRPLGDLVNGDTEMSLSSSDNALLMQYKELIREQDRQLQELRQQTESLERERSMAESQVEELNSTVQQLRDHNMLLRAQQNTSGRNLGQGDAPSCVDGEVEILQSQLQQAKLEAKKWKDLAEQRETDFKTFEDQLSHDSELSMVVMGTTSNEDLNSLRKQLEEARASLKEKDGEILRLRSSGVVSIISTSDGVNDVQAELQECNKKIAELEERNKELGSAKSDLDKLRVDQEDLLELLADQDSTIQNLKVKLSALGEKVDDDEAESPADEEYAED